MAFNFNNQRMGFGNNNTGNQFSKSNFGARSIDDIKEEMNNLKYNQFSKKEKTPEVKKEREGVNHQSRVNALNQINGFNKRI